jgi:uracil-DNA glycosylase family protein
MPEHEHDSAADFIPPNPSLPKLRKAASHCEGCELYKCATQTVFGEGPADSKVIFVGEEPGDYEDQIGHPFVGPAGKLLRKVLEQVGIDPKDVYYTNAIKHFKFEPRGKRRIHQKPRTSEINACRPWLEAEIGQIHPALVVCLGASAAQAVFGKHITISRLRGNIVSTELAPRVYVTIHPSAILRAPDRETRHQMLRDFTEEMKRIKKLISGH